MNDDTLGRARARLTELRAALEDVADPRRVDRIGVKVDYFRTLDAAVTALLALATAVADSVAAEDAKRAMTINQMADEVGWLKWCAREREAGEAMRAALVALAGDDPSAPTAEAAP